MKSISKLILSMVIAVSTLVACGGSDTPLPTTKVVGADVTVALNPANGAQTVAAIVGDTFTFGAIPAFGTTSTTTLTFTGGGNTPTFSISSGGRTASGTTTFGSCIFTFTSSNFALGTGPQVGQVITINPCTLKFGIEGKPADGTSSQVTVTFTLGTLTSSIKLPVSVAADGTITIDGTKIPAKATVVTVTGA